MNPARPPHGRRARGGGFLDTLLIALLVVLALMLAAGLFVLYRFVL